MPDRSLRFPPQVASARVDLHARIDNDFVYHAPTEGQPELYGSIRERFRKLAHELVDDCPPGRELAVALTKLDEAVFWANAAIARNG